MSGFKTRHHVITVAEGICGRISLFTDFGVSAFFSRTRLGYTGEWMNPDLPFLLAAQIAAFFIMIFMGFVSVRTGIIGTEETKGLTRMLMYVITPCVILMSYQTEYSSSVAGGLVLAFLAAVLVHVILIAGVKLAGRFLRLSNVERASIIYTNSGNLTVPLVMSVLGTKAVMYASTFLAVQTILVWTHCFALIKGTSGFSWKKMMSNVNTIAIILGIICFFAEIRITGPLETAFTGMGKTIGPLAMFSIGIMLGSSRVTDIFRIRNFMVSAMRLLLFPVIPVLLFALWPEGLLSDDSRLVFTTVLLATAAPSAVIVSQMALITNQDYRSASGVNIITDFLCIFTIPFIIWIYIIISD